jgi:tetratricopeptide (TPR) repeat protein
LRDYALQQFAGAIGSLGSQYVLEVKAVNCQSGDTLGEEQVTAASKENVLDVLGEAASKLRGELGESLATVQKFDVPLEQATTPSLEALKMFSLGIKAFREKGAAADLPFSQHAVELDPNFAIAYLEVGVDYLNLGEVGRAREYFSKAFQLREHASEREKLRIIAEYYRNVTGELDKAAQTYQMEIESYPRRGGVYNNLGIVYGDQGQYEKAMEMTRQALRLAPALVADYDNLANFALALKRFDEARQIVHEAQARKGDDFVLHGVIYALAFVEANSPAMAEQQQWFAGKPEFENFGLAFASDTEACGGHLGKARELTKRAVDSAIRADSKEAGAIWQANAALQQAAYGNTTESRRTAAEALKLAPTSQGVEVETALAFAMAGDTVRAESLAQDLRRRFPLDTQMQLLWLPAIHAQLALDRKNPASALQAASPIELGEISFVNNISCLYHVYVRGEAYLAAGQGTAAAVRVSEDPRPQRHRLELLDGSLGASGSSSCERLAVENRAGSGCRCRPRPGTRRLQRFPHALERRRPRHPHPEASPSGVREAALASRSGPAPRASWIARGSRTDLASTRENTNRETRETPFAHCGCRSRQLL